MGPWLDGDKPDYHVLIAASASPATPPRPTDEQVQRALYGKDWRGVGAQAMIDPNYLFRRKLLKPFK